MNKGSRLERLAEFFMRESLRGELTQFLVHQRQELVRGVWVAGCEVSRLTDYSKGRGTSRSV
jgi:hypothetical protein